MVASPGNRFGADDVTCGKIRSLGVQSKAHCCATLVANSDHSNPQPAANVNYQGPRPLFRHLGITTRPPRSFRATFGLEEHSPDARNFVAMAGEGRDPILHSPTLTRNALPNNGTLEALVAQGWTWNPPPEPHVPGPSTWLNLRPPPSVGHDAALGGRKRHIRSYSIDGIDEILGDSSSVSKSSKRQQFEQWETKGGLNVASPLASTGFRPKALTDVSMACSMGVEPGEEVTSQVSKKRSAVISPPIPAGKNGFSSALKEMVTLPTNFPLKQLKWIIVFRSW
ncbi:hypothetical protein BVRB_4g096110 [Beta vulgaris subsp. vulgaris]|uniref:Uncharacterized protein n=1 Tax=Beta vulgaris subsp. vulgaris TaxID=3555 RepID=A0A0J8B9T5_BETVV|nr:hypothetical protein BVRB_4g096110 [Beta vulgaris subsp. vulgaris]